MQSPCSGCYRTPGFLVEPGHSNHKQKMKFLRRFGVHMTAVKAELVLEI